MIEDMRHLAWFAALADEIQILINQFNSRSNGLTDKAELITLRLEEIEQLTQLLNRHRRALLNMRGDKIEPETHLAEVVLTGVGGQNA